MHIRENASLKPFNTFGIDVKARSLAYITDTATLYNLLTHKNFKPLPKLMLGAGSNVLFTRNFPGVVVKMEIGGITKTKEDEVYVWVKAGAGVCWHTLVLHCIGQGYGGIENLSLIPGTVGAAPIQNIGAYGVELQSIFAQLEAMAMDSGNTKTFNQKDCAFGYRDSVFKNALKGKYVITHVTLRLRKQPVFCIDYGDIKATLTTMGIKKLSIKAISDAVIRIRQSKLPAPEQIGNAGSFFKNPTLDKATFEVLKTQYPILPGYTLAQKKVKIPAAWLI